MNTPVISIDSLQFAYQRHQPILQDLSLRVPQGSIYGFLGANGAGKSTTIRTVLGLHRAQFGVIRLFGQALSENRQGLFQRIGTLIEAPSHYRHLSGYDNLKIACRYLDISFDRIPEVLEMVKLSPHAQKVTKHYSTGMKQRLGLALALLNDPELLILDEPTNGLDPNGIREIRSILQNLNAAGKTIFLSSHLLSEIERIATQVGILHEGKMAFEGTIAELEQLRKRQQRIRLVASDAPRAKKILNGHYETTLLDDKRLDINLLEHDSLPGITTQLVNQGIEIYELSPLKDDLEQLFIDVTTEKH